MNKVYLKPYHKKSGSTLIQFYHYSYGYLYPALYIIFKLGFENEYYFQSINELLDKKLQGLLNKLNIKYKFVEMTKTFQIIL